MVMQPDLPGIGSCADTLGVETPARNRFVVESLPTTPAAHAPSPANGGAVNYRAVMETLVAALDTHDDDTACHARRVTEFALRITRRVDPALARDPALPYAFLLHDIGKIGIPDSILRKAGPLSCREQRIIRRHTILGERLLALTPSLPTLVHDVVAYHHEHWDGGGYPYGLRGEEIPLVARIFAVADAYDALTNDRPYRTAVPVSAAIAELRACAGMQFDPDVIGAFPGAESRPRAAHVAGEPKAGIGTQPAERLGSSFLTNHALVLTCIAEERDVPVRAIAARVGITERATQAILSDLVNRGYVQRTRVGRRNRYRLVHTALLGHGFRVTVTLGDLVDILRTPSLPEPEEPAGSVRV